jgi:hypothetical protein
MASYAMLLGINAGRAEVLGAPVDLSDAKRKFAQIVQDGGVLGGSAYDELWLCDTAHGRLRRKAFCHAPAEPTQAPEKRLKR